MPFTQNILHSLINIVLIAMLFCYSFMEFNGSTLNGYCIEFIFWNAATGDIFYGIFPLLGIIGILTSIAIREKKIIYTISFLLLTIPLLIDILLYDKVAMHYQEFYLPLILNLMASIFCFYMIFNKSTNQSKKYDY